MDRFGGLDIWVEQPASALWMARQDGRGSEGSERNLRPAEGSGDSGLRFTRIGLKPGHSRDGWIRHSRRSGVTSDMSRPGAVRRS